MKKVIAIIAAIAWTITPANADVYVKVDANGNALGGPIMCDAETCGANSLYSQLTLGEGERYVLQGHGYSGIGNNNLDTAVKVNVETKEWTVTTPTTVSTFTPDTPPTYVWTAPIQQETTTAITDTATVTSDTATATIKNVTVSDAYAEIMALLTRIFQLLAILNR
jgi:hypothetical protein